MGLQMIKEGEGKCINPSPWSLGSTKETAFKHPVRLALLDEAGPTGTFSNERRQLPW